ncbi:serine/threonine-protein kinase pim-1-like [Enoplosus armatus]|uniref:serine/threonine-protein kinase pim-1-like n=1 Tax=Enoplosus armatus TaxID=215367 RepID=UPI0039961FAC
MTNEGRHTDPANYAAEDCRSSGNKKTSKRNSEESLERASKRSRTSQSPSEGCSQTLSRPSSSSASAYTGPPARTGETQSRKRKSTSGESEDGPRKRSRGTSTSTIEGRKSGQRTSEEPEGPRKRSRKRGHSHQDTTDASSSEKPATSLSTNTDPPDGRAAFEAKYEEEELLGSGGFGSVFAGHCRDNNLPVAIKHIPQFDIERIPMLLDGNVTMVPKEVALLLKVKPAAAGTSAAVTLLDWYDLDNELILVQERPVPCMDLVDYMNSRASFLQEHEAKILTKQLVDALIEIHSKGVFHRDIKLDNILIETGSDIPRVRIIDFGCGTLLSKNIYIAEQGTFEYSSPDWFRRGWYRAEPTTVWQLGVVLFGMLHRCLPFDDITEIISEEPDIRDGLSFDCQDFLKSCLAKSAESRPTLETLKHHPWLI